MLVLSRKIGEKIVINDNVTVVIQRIVGNRVALGIEAPQEVAVMRGELLERDAAEARDEVIAQPVVGRIGFDQPRGPLTAVLRRVAR